MKILFSNPPWFTTKRNPSGPGHLLRQGIRAGSRWPFTIPAYYKPDQFRFGGYYPFPFFMGYAASYVQKAFPDAEVVFRDSITRGESYESYRKFLTEYAPDFIFIESATASADHDSRVVQNIIRKILPSAIIVLTGPIAGEKAADFADAQIKGEYEKGSVRVINGERGLIQHDMLSMSEMNNAPIPMFDRATQYNYWDSNPIGQAAPHLQVWGSRGCPFRCCFCVWPAVMTGNDPTGTGKRMVRNYTADYMLNQLRERLNGGYIQSSTKPCLYKSVYFDDDTFNLQDKHTAEMCGVMREVKLPWSAMCRADTSSRAIWKEMKDSGCFGVKLGFESGSQEVIDTIINKKLNLEEGEATVHYLKELGMTVHGTFTVGLPGETDAQRQETIAFIKKLPLDSYQLSGTAEIEGTPLATMKKGEALQAYPNAIKDEHYHASPDGQLKREGMSV